MQKGKNQILSQIIAGFSAFLLVMPLTLSFAAVTEQGLLTVVICSVMCCAFSVKQKNGIFAPYPLLFVPFAYILCSGSLINAALSVCMGACAALICSGKMNNLNIAECIPSGISLGLCLGATILLTNSYFGIGAYGATPVEMLKSYRSLGFHPNFMGLLTGTITLFTMITYPFKFKKFNKIIPAPFITLAIPYVLNLLLNPDKKYTAINEADSLMGIINFNIPNELLNFDITQISLIIKGGFAFFIIFSLIQKQNNCKVCYADLVSVFPVLPQDGKNLSLIPAVTAAALSIITVFIFPYVLSRLPLHCAGSMLIVFAWQSLPYKKIKAVFSQKNSRAQNILCFMICAIAFVISDVFTASILCIALCTISTVFRRKELV